MPESDRHAEIATRLIDGRTWVSQPAVAPDGEHVACVVATIDHSKNTTVTRVWLDGEPLTGGEHDADPVWSPDGRRLAFTARRGEKKGDATLHVIPVEAVGEVRTLGTFPEPVESPRWSPDGKWIAFVSRTRHERYEAEDESWQSPRKVERFMARLNGEDWILDRPAHVYVVAADGTAPPRNLTPGPFQHQGVSWLGDSSGVVTSAARHDTWDRDLAEDLYVIPLTRGEPRRLTAGDGMYTRPSVSPDGSKVAFIASVGLDTYPQNERVMIASTTEDDQPASSFVDASAGLDRTFTPTVGAPPPVWVDNDTILATAEDRGSVQLYELAAAGSTPPGELVSGAVSVTGFAWAAGVLATTRTTVRSVGELYVGEERRSSVGDHWAEQLLGWEHFTAPTTDGTGEIDAWVMRPAGFDPAQRYPVLLNVHGGPFAQYGEYFFDEAQMQAASGFVVVLGNPRGGSGRHTEWGQAILGPSHPVNPGTGWGSVDIDDVMAILDTALEQYRFCDPDRVGMLGGSYGGYMATWLAVRHGHRFRGLCSERAVNNLTALEWSSDIATMFRLEHGVNHLEDPVFYAERSPISYVSDIDTPMLIIHSEEDWRCPIGQAEELWIALRLLEREVDFYRFPGENHELSRSGSPVHRVQRAGIILDWFAEKLGATT